MSILGRRVEGGRAERWEGGREAGWKGGRVGND